MTEYTLNWILNKIGFYASFILKKFRTEFTKFFSCLFGTDLSVYPYKHKYKLKTRILKL